MENYFNYFTEIEEQFQRRRGSLLLLSTVDWALIETWRDGGIPLEAVLRGINAAFDKYDTRNATSRARRINGLAYCVQEIMAAVEEMKEASIGRNPEQPAPASSGFEQERVAVHLLACAKQLTACRLTGLTAELAHETAESLQRSVTELQTTAVNLEDLERKLEVLEQKLFNTLMATEAEASLLTMREQSAKEIAPYRSRMQAVQIRQLEQQFLHKKLLEKYNLPRFSLFYMSHG